MRARSLGAQVYPASALLRFLPGCLRSLYQQGLFSLLFQHDFVRLFFWARLPRGLHFQWHRRKFDYGLHWLLLEIFFHALALRFLEKDHANLEIIFFAKNRQLHPLVDQGHPCGSVKVVEGEAGIRAALLRTKRNVVASIMPANNGHQPIVKVVTDPLPMSFSCSGRNNLIRNTVRNIARKSAYLEPGYLE